ncbi:MAG: hypothetical protein L3J73_00450 [Thermoplasmata archaeon]|nr:hypothetical protein [Thermoplasmata archaeon]
MTVSAWTAVIEITDPDPTMIDRLARTLGPEAAREVPRARARLERAGPAQLLVRLEARDTGALRAGLNTFLGWIDLAASTERVARELAPSGPKRLS